MRLANWFNYLGHIEPSYDDYIEVLDPLEEERRIWVDWEENRFGKRIRPDDLLPNIGTISPNNT